VSSADGPPLEGGRIVCWREINSRGIPAHKVAIAKRVFDRLQKNPARVVATFFRRAREPPDFEWWAGSHEAYEGRAC